MLIRVIRTGKPHHEHSPRHTNRHRQGTEGTEWSWEDDCTLCSHWDYFLWDPLSRKKKKKLNLFLWPQLLFPICCNSPSPPHLSGTFVLSVWGYVWSAVMRAWEKKINKEKGLCVCGFTCRIRSICIIEGGTLARGRDRASSSFRLRVMIFLKWSRANWRTDGSFPWRHAHVLP